MTTRRVYFKHETVTMKKNRQIRLISRWMRVDRYFDEYKKERYFTHEGAK